MKLLLFTLSAVGALASINLKGFDGCSKDQRAKISSSWENAVKMGGTIKGNIDFNEAAAVEYLGPPAFTSDFANAIRDVFANVATFGQGSILVPVLFKWDVYVRCDDWKSRCHTFGVQAYTSNHMGRPSERNPLTHHEHRMSTPVINFCEGYFSFPTLAEKLQQNKNEPVGRKYNLEYYSGNRDSLMFHEMMHADMITYERNYNRHISDMRMKVRKSTNWQTVYGTSLVKLFPLAEETYGEGLVTQNADSWSSYALAKMVQKGLGNKYPYLPRPYNDTVDDSTEDFKPHPARNGRLRRSSWSTDMEGSLDEEPVPHELCLVTHEDEDHLYCIPIPTAANDSTYPKEYLEARKAWGEEMASMKFETPLHEAMNAGPMTDSVSRNCNYDPLLGNPLDPIDTDIAESKIKEVCKLFDGITLDGEKQRIVQTHYEGVGAEMHPYLAWNAGDPQCIDRGNSTISEGHCIDMFHDLINGCASDIPTKTYGGSKVDSCVVFGFDI